MKKYNSKMDNHVDKTVQRIVYFDVDGTLLDMARGLPLSARTIEAIKQLQRNGIIVAINTGRGHGFIPSDVRAVGFDSYVTGCGTYITHNNRVIKDIGYTHEESQRVVDVFREARLDMIMEGPEHIYFEPESFDPETAYDSSHLFDHGHSTKRFPQDKIVANKISYMLTSQDKDVYVRGQLADIMHFICHPNMREGMPHGCTKATGMKHLEDVIGSSFSYSFGDSINDLDMFAHSNVSICMGNAPAHVKAKADYVAPDLADEGIAVMLERLELI